MSIEITKEMLTAAKDYVPISVKGEWVQEVAERCFDRLSITYGEEQMPPMYAINTEVKSRYLMGFFVQNYLGILGGEVTSEPWLMPEEEYDAWAGSHIFGQIDRWKHDAEVRDKCYDLMADYKDLEKRLSSRISGMLAVQNDPVIRQTQDMAKQMESLPALLEQLKQLQDAKGEKDDGGTET